MDWQLFVSTFIFIFVAELPDKTAFATVLMSAKGRAWPVFIGACAAFFVQSLVAITFGSFFNALPKKWVHLGVGLLFLVFAFSAVRKSRDEDEAPGENEIASENEIDSNSEFAAPKSSKKVTQGFWRSAGASFMVIFIAEWGDLTQLATASLQAKYGSPITIFCAATLALWSVTGIAVIVGSHAKKFLHPAWLNRIAAGAFLIVGLSFLISWLRE